MSASGYKFIWPAAYEGPDRCEFFSQGGKGDAFTTFLKGFYAARSLIRFSLKSWCSDGEKCTLAKKVSSCARKDSWWNNLRRYYWWLRCKNIKIPPCAGKILDETIWGVQRLWYFLVRTCLDLKKMSTLLDGLTLNLYNFLLVGAIWYFPSLDLVNMYKKKLICTSACWRNWIQWRWNMRSPVVFKYTWLMTLGGPD